MNLRAVVLLFILSANTVLLLSSSCRQTVCTVTFSDDVPLCFSAHCCCALHQEIHELKDQIQDVESKYTQNLKQVKVYKPERPPELSTPDSLFTNFLWGFQPRYYHSGSDVQTNKLFYNSGSKINTPTDRLLTWNWDKETPFSILETILLLQTRHKYWHTHSLV